MMLNDKTGLGHLTEILIQRGITELIISPGSRNAPIVTEFCKRSEFNCLTIVDERSAAFFALGMAQQLRKPVVIACTSGSAALNYAPAIAEAYYQQVPLLVLTADRPAEWIDQGDGQTIRQKDVYANYIKKSVQLPQSLKYQNDLSYSNRLISEALNACVYPTPGPVHINLPFTEPLYGFDSATSVRPKDFTITQATNFLTKEVLDALINEWNQSGNKLILAGQMHPNSELEKQLIQLSEKHDVVVMSETTSNVSHESFIMHIDRTLSAMSGKKTPYIPDLLITIGGTIVSKRIKAEFRQAGIKKHWHVDVGALPMDTFQKLSRVIPILSTDLFSQMLPMLPRQNARFTSLWHALDAKAKTNHKKFLQNCAYSDLKILEQVFIHIPPGYDIQLGNSTPVRYAQLFDFKESFRFDSNRGTSGIDGSLSTAAGAAFASNRPTVMLTGDLGFFYDSNALWNKHLPSKLKIIIINNEGGNIFRFIEGPDSTGFMDDYFEARHRTSAKHIALAYDIDYMEVSDMEGLNKQLTLFFRPSEKAAILEINSPAEENAKVLRNYFKVLGQ